MNNTIDIFKTLSNETRLTILNWLKDPSAHFPEQTHLRPEDDFQQGVCVGDIQAKANLSQSTVSHYLSLMQKSGLLESKRVEQWTYYRRNEQGIQAFIAALAKDL
ncbi:ArsR/SmtB family transcription factor [Enterococcus sp. DIV0876]|uniref:ArsR/SmtB family transcription factor n=1 Tax=Enterococcus sp. DIV0876 TaxID=2774633 RepID=UPI003D3004FA